MEWQVPLADLDYGPEESQAVLDVLNSRWLTMGSVTQEFEGKFAEHIHVRHALAVSNGTVALHLACLALGIGPGDEVIVPALTFVATSNAVLYTGAQVRFADILGKDELTISPDEIERLITDRTKAVIVMHYGGFPCRMPEIMEIASKHGLKVIEDAAHAPGASLNGKSLGTWGDVGCFSFFSNKNLSTGEGGMLVTNQDAIAERVRLMRSHGMTSMTWDRHLGHAYSYDVVDLGYNYRLDEIRSALGLVQLQKLAVNNQKRAAITNKYWDAFSKLSESSSLGLPFRVCSSSQEISPAYHIFPLLLPESISRGKLVEGMKAAGVQTSMHYPPVHQFSFYKKFCKEISLPNTEFVAAQEVTIPLYPSMNDQQFNTVVQEIQEQLRG